MIRFSTQLAPKLAPPPTGLPDIFAAYPVKNFDEAYLPDGSVRGHYAALLEGFGALSSAEFRRRRGLIELTLRTQGITFTVYGDAEGTERPFPFDPFPRVIPAPEWERPLAAGAGAQPIPARHLQRPRDP